MPMDIVEDLHWRHLMEFINADLKDWLSIRGRHVFAAYGPAGFHRVSDLLPLMVLRRFQKCGHRPMVVLYGSTEPEIDTTIIHSIVKAQIFNDYEWTNEITWHEFLGCVGTKSLSKGLPIVGRLEQMVHAYAALQMFDYQGVRLQVGDRWDSIHEGISLVKRIRKVDVYGLSVPEPIMPRDVYLDKRTTPFEFYQYWLSLDDDTAGMFLRYFTDITPEECHALDLARIKDPKSRNTQNVLAADMTRMIHGDEALSRAIRATQILFGERIAANAMTDAEIATIFQGVPHGHLPRNQLNGDGLNIVDALVWSGLGDHVGQVRRVINDGGVYVNNERITSVTHNLTYANLVGQTTVVLRIGKRKYGLLRFC